MMENVSVTQMDPDETRKKTPNDIIKKILRKK